MTTGHDILERLMQKHYWQTENIDIRRRVPGSVNTMCEHVCDGNCSDIERGMCMAARMYSGTDSTAVDLQESHVCMRCCRSACMLNLAFDDWRHGYQYITSTALETAGLLA